MTSYWMQHLSWTVGLVGAEHPCGVHHGKVWLDAAAQIDYCRVEVVVRVHAATIKDKAHLPLERGSHLWKNWSWPQGLL